MKNDKLFHAIGQIDDEIIKECSPTMNISPNKRNFSYTKWLVAAAGVALVVGLSIQALPKNNVTNPSYFTVLTPSVDSPTGIRKILNYNGMRYAFLEDGATFLLNNIELEKKLGKISYEISYDSKENLKDEYASTYAYGGTIYSIKNYDPSFRVAVVLGDNVFLCESVSNLDNSAIDLTSYFENAKLQEITEDIDILDHNGHTVLSTIKKGDKNLLLQLVASSLPASLEKHEYESIAKAQVNGESYFIRCNLTDKTTFDFYVIPNLGIAMVGDQRFFLPDNFLTECGGYFENLTQQKLPMGS